MSETDKEISLCREWEQFAATLSVLMRGQAAERPANAKIDRAIEENIVSVEREMLRISRELRENLDLAGLGDPFPVEVNGQDRACA